ncbi:MAG: reactive intermediate/imine deaminase [Pelagibacteraceae bacterium]|jgi:reactive intermediate/imine deaminase|nr:RidA family protein [SAR86 cluster bacterium]PCH49213.1 MAG: reactive intermediate/imine deaminase [Pelagibacteraceae bacterium]HIC26848.1 RidA family protein [Gammaproteobacteria bacterium]
MKEKVETNNAPKALGTYSQAITSGNTTYMSGQIPIDPETMELVEGNENQIRQVFKNILSVCEASGASTDQIVKLNIYLSDLSVFAEVNEIMRSFFTEPYPARAAVQVAKLPLDSLIEIEGIIVQD